MRFDDLFLLPAFAERMQAETKRVKSRMHLLSK